MAQVGVSAHVAGEGLEGRGVRLRELGDDAGGDFWGDRLDIVAIVEKNREF